MNLIGHQHRVARLTTGLFPASFVAPVVSFGALAFDGSMRSAWTGGLSPSDP